MGVEMDNIEYNTKPVPGRLFEPGLPDKRVWPSFPGTNWRSKYEECKEERKKLERFLDRLGIEYKDIYKN